MIISDKYKYLFLEVPHTGSTAISKELRAKYDGREILHKHANYHEFLKIASKQQKKYYVFAGVRNPLDEVVSLYNKFLTNHDGNYTNPDLLLENGGWVTKRKVELFKMVQKNKDFEEFVRKSYRTIYTSNADINKKHCNYIMRFENLENDFSQVLKNLGIKKIRPLPVANKTKKKGKFEDYYTQSLAAYVTKNFGPYMKEWGYKLPPNFRNSTPPLRSRIIYKLSKVGRLLYSTYIKEGPFKKVTFIRNVLE